MLPSHLPQRVYLDLETTGLRWWADDRPVGIALATDDGDEWYLPVGHRGENLPEERVREFLRDQLRGKHVVGFNLPFDVCAGHPWGLDLEALGCTLTDVGFLAMLLDDRRRRTSLDAVSQEYLGQGKVRNVDARRMATYEAWEVKEYACRDVTLCRDLLAKLTPKIEAEHLTRVARLECDLIYATCAMMRRGVKLDEEKLNRWITRSEQDVVNLLWKIKQDSGVTVNPGSRDDMVALFAALRLPLPRQPVEELSERDSYALFQRQQRDQAARRQMRLPGMEREPDVTDDGKISFQRHLLRRYVHPTVRDLAKVRALVSLRSKFLLKYRDDLKKSSDGRLRYSLHQMPIDDEGGARSGRYSSSGFGGDLDEGVNVQQVAGKKQQHSVAGDAEMAEYVVRELYLPDSGYWMSADASQIEYRLFAHYAKPPSVMSAYARDPITDFHNVVWELVKQRRPDATRERTKDVNFAKIYGAGVDKIARMLGITPGEAQEFVSIYDEMFPQAGKLLHRVSKTAERRGWVRTLLGRRRRFDKGDPRLYSALNGVIQGSAADEMKLKALLLYETRRQTGLEMKFLVHDEVNGDVPDVESAVKVQRLLNMQLLDTAVPLMWEVGVGDTWKAAQKGTKQAAENDHGRLHEVAREIGRPIGGMESELRGRYAR